MQNFESKESNAGKHLIYNLIILDESGSMSSVRSETVQGISSVFSSIKEGMEKFPDQDHRISLVSFSSRSSSEPNCRFILWNEPADKIPAEFADSYCPEGGTPLYDAIGVSLHKLRHDLSGLAQDRYNVLVTILTDGEENSSGEFSYQQVKKSISELSEGSWTFAYIGAGLDAYEVAQSLNIMNSMSYRPDSKGIAALFQKTRQATDNFIAAMSIPAQRSYSRTDFFNLDNPKEHPESDKH